METQSFAGSRGQNLDFDERVVEASAPAFSDSLFQAAYSNYLDRTSGRGFERAGNENTERYKFSEADYGEAVRQAAAQGKPLFIKVGAEWCAPCQAMERGAIPQVAGKLQKDAIYLNIDVDKAPDLAKQLGVTSYPTSLVASVRNKDNGALELVPVARREGGMSGAQLSQFLDQSLPVAERQMRAAGFSRRSDGRVETGDKNPRADTPAKASDQTEKSSACCAQPLADMQGQPPEAFLKYLNKYKEFSDGKLSPGRDVQPPAPVQPRPEVDPRPEPRPDPRPGPRPGPDVPQPQPRPEPVSPDKILPGPGPEPRPSPEVRPDVRPDPDNPQPGPRPRPRPGPGPSPGPRPCPRPG